jgi:L-serine dehydratase
MKPLSELYRIGRGPSSSHTMAPARAAAQFKEKFPQAAAFRATLLGSFGATGKGHLTDQAIIDSFAPKQVDIVFAPSQSLPEHPNALRFEAFDAEQKLLGQVEEFSIGGGALMSDSEAEEIYTWKTLSEILEYTEDSGKSFWECVVEIEGEVALQYLDGIWQCMCESINKGLRAEGVVPGGLGLSRKAISFHRKTRTLSGTLRDTALIASYAYAVSEENACGGNIVTAPTCGSAGTMPAVLYFLQQETGCEDIEVIRAIATASLFGNIVKNNASISGAMVGCQGEIGTACAMAAAAAAQLLGGTPRQIEYAAEMGLEHHLGLTCDPVGGLVQIPCIERNAHAADRAIGCARFALLSDGTHRISFDDVVAVMYETGLSLPNRLKETSLGGLAVVYEKRIKERAKKGMH